MHHVCLSSNQPLPNLTPLAGGHLQASGVSIITPPERKRHALWLQRALQMTAPQCPVHIVDMTTAYDLGEAMTTLQRVAEAHPAGCTVNITGGSKLLTLAAWQTFRRPKDRIFYVSPQDDALLWLHPHAGREPVRDVLTLPAWLVAHGLAPMAEAPPQRPDRTVLKAAADAASATINRIASAYAREDTRRARGLSRGEGHWLEDYLAYHLAGVFLQQPDKRARLQDFSGPFKVCMIDQPSVINELDGVALYDNRLTLFEAKSGTDAEQSGAVDAIYKLSRLRDRLGGWISQGVFVSARKVSEDAKQRAAEYGVAVIDAPMLPQLRRHIEAVLLKPNPI